MITARTLGQQVLDRLKLFTTDRDITLNDAILAVQQAVADIVVKKKEAERVRDQVYGYDGMLYFLFENVTVTNNKFQLPATPMSVPFGQGMYVMKAMGEVPYIQLPHGFNSYKQLPAATIGGEMGYYIIGHEGYFIENAIGLEPPSAVTIQMLCPVMDANADFYMMIPGDIQQAVLDTVLQRMGATAQVVSDETKDDVDNKA